MKNCKRILCFGLALAFVFSCAIGASAKNYLANVVDEDFASASNCKFVAPGDMNGDGAVNASDSVALRKLLLNGKSGGYDEVVALKGADAKFSDTNGDSAVDVRDLVRQKKNIVSMKKHIADGALQLNGICVYGGPISDAMGANVEYTLSYTYTSDEAIKVVISGLGDDIVFEEAAATGATVTHKFTTPYSFEGSKGAELKILGNGTVSDFSLTRPAFDNEFEEIW